MTRRNITRGLSLLLGLGMVFIGARFLLAPRMGAEGFGVFLPVGSNYAFHYAKGVRDLFSGLLLVVFASLGDDRALRWVLLLGALIPCVDLAVVLAQPTAALALAMPHIVMVSRGIAPPAATSEPCVRLSPHTAPRRVPLLRAAKLPSCFVFWS